MWLAMMGWPSCFSRNSIDKGQFCCFPSSYAKRQALFLGAIVGAHCYYTAKIRYPQEPRRRCFVPALFASHHKIVDAIGDLNKREIAGEESITHTPDACTQSHFPAFNPSGSTFGLANRQRNHPYSARRGGRIALRSTRINAAHELNFHNSMMETDAPPASANLHRPAVRTRHFSSRNGETPWKQTAIVNGIALSKRRKEEMIEPIQALSESALAGRKALSTLPPNGSLATACGTPTRSILLGLAGTGQK